MMRHTKEQIKHLELLNEVICVSILSYLKEKKGRVLKTDVSEFCDNVVKLTKETPEYFLVNRVFGITHGRAVNYIEDRACDFFGYCIRDGKIKTIKTINEHLNNESK